MTSLAGSGIDRRAVSVTRTRRSAGSYNADGDFVPGTPTTGTILAVVQPVSGRQLMDLPEGVRSEARWLAWSRAEIRLDDVIVAGGLSHRVIYVWPRAEGEFYRAAMGELGA
jgi:hypothetical protein